MIENKESLPTFVLVSDDYNFKLLKLHKKTTDFSDKNTRTNDSSRAVMINIL